MPSSPTIGENLEAVQARLKKALRDAGRAETDTRLVAVSKSQSTEHIRAALAAGQREFGENRVQEAQAKWPALKREYPDIVLHLVGPLQSNKAGEAVALFDVIQTLDRPKLARVLAEEMARQNRRPVCLVQVNTGAEPQKSGVAPEEADALIAACRGEYKLPVAGLMCIPPLDEEPSLHFALLAEIAKRNALPELSMGMSGDFEIAAAFGATMVRVGTAVFGARGG